MKEQAHQHQPTTIPLPFEVDDPKLSSQQETIDRLKANVASGKLDTLITRVAWILNFFPEARDSDVTLQILYWKNFEANIFGGIATAENLYKLTRLTSIARARATIQNTYRLYQSSEEVKKHRRRNAEDEKTQAISRQESTDSFAVYADESGKVGETLIVGSVWFTGISEISALTRELENARKGKELHLTEMTRNDISLYENILAILKDHMSFSSYKAISVPAKGSGDKDAAIGKLYYHLLARGVEHEHATGRGPLPRSLSLWKDQDNEAKDLLLLADIKDRLKNAAAAQFQGELSLGSFQPFRSHDLVLLQVADLFTGSINRMLATGFSDGHFKSRFAQQMLEMLGVTTENEAMDGMSDVAMHFSV